MMGGGGGVFGVGVNASTRNLLRLDVGHTLLKLYMSAMCVEVVPEDVSGF